MAGEPDIGELGLVRSFVNTLEKSTTPGKPDEEWLPTLDSLRDWMGEQGIPPGDLAPDDLARARDFREAVRALLSSNNGIEKDLPAGPLSAAAEQGLIRVSIDRSGRALFEPAAPGLPALYARVLAAIADAQVAGTWERLKACAADDCEWAYYDTSKNRSRTWCSMDVCGNRAKTRAYRKRRQAGG